METTPLLVAVPDVPEGEEEAPRRLGGLTLKELLLEAETRRWCRLRAGALWLLWASWCVAFVAAVVVAVAAPGCQASAASQPAVADVQQPPPFHLQLLQHEAAPAPSLKFPRPLPNNK